MSGGYLPPLVRGHGVIINGTRSDWVVRYDVVVAVTLAALPLAMLTGWLLARRRRRSGATAGWAWRSSMCEVAIVYGTAPWVWLTMLPGSGAGAVRSQLSLVPLRDLQTMPTYQVLGNLLVFAALGAFGPMRFRALASLPRVTALGALGSIMIETAQYVLPIGRVASVDDVLLNTVGAGVAAIVTFPWRRCPNTATGLTTRRSRGGPRASADRPAQVARRSPVEDGARPAHHGAVDHGTVEEHTHAALADGVEHLVCPGELVGARSECRPDDRQLGRVDRGAAAHPESPATGA